MSIWRPLPVRPPWQPQPLKRPAAQGTTALATSYSLSGVSSGFTGVPYTYTVQPNGRLTGDLVVTPAIATITGTFTPSTLTFHAAGSDIPAAQTFTFTPTSGGTGNLSATHTSTDTLSDPAPISFTSTASATLDLTTSIADNGTGTNPSAYVQVEGGAVLRVNAGTNSWTVVGAASGSTMSDGAVRFRATLSALDLHVYQNASPLSLFVDGVRKFTATLANTSSFATTSGLFTGLDGSVEHEYLLCWDTTGGMFVDKLILTGTVNSTTLAKRTMIAFLGDSITQGTSGPTYSSLSWAREIGNALNCQVANRGIGSTGIYYPGGAGNSAVNRIADITGILPVPDIVHILDGVNDLLNGVSQGNFTTAYNTILTTIRAASGFSAVPVVVEGVLKQSAGDTSMNTMNGWISGIVSALGDSHTVYRDGEVTAYDGSTNAGNLHPNVLGSAVVAVAGAIDVRPYLPAAASGTGGVFRSGSFTGGMQRG